VGGDFYDCFLVDTDHLYFVLGDVSDKGVPAALLMAVTKTLLGASAAGADSPAAILGRVNHQTVVNNDACMFVTVFCGILDVRTGRVLYMNAGHNPPAVLRSGGGVEFLACGLAPPLGIDEDARYGVCDVQIDPGDILCMYTDGVTEAMNGRGEMFSEERLRAALCAVGERAAQDVATGIVQAVMAFSGDAPQADDIALLILQRGRDHEAAPCAPNSA
jgi:sigma-B regulation protein RsbU (phosphoserine phosphatase)